MAPRPPVLWSFALWVVARRVTSQKVSNSFNEATFCSTWTKILNSKWYVGRDDILRELWDTQTLEELVGYREIIPFVYIIWDGRTRKAGRREDIPLPPVVRGIVHNLSKAHSLIPPPDQALTPCMPAERCVCSITSRDVNRFLEIMVLWLTLACVHLWRTYSWKVLLYACKHRQQNAHDIQSHTLLSSRRGVSWRDPLGVLRLKLCS